MRKAVLEGWNFNVQKTGKVQGSFGGTTFNLSKKMSVNINGSISRFMAVSAQNSLFVDNDVVNMRQGGAVKAGTYRPGNIFRRLFRTNDEELQNNNTRQEFLDSLKEAFDLRETGQALVRRLSTILGEGVFKPDDYTFDENGRVNCGQPLTARRITAVSNRINSLKNREVEKKIRITAAKIFRSVPPDIIRLFDGGKIPHITEEEAVKIMQDVGCFFNDTDDHGNLFRPYVGLPAGLRYAISLLNLNDSVKENEVYNALMDNLMDQNNANHTICEEHENAINEHYRIAGEERPEMDGLGNVKGHEKEGSIAELLKDLDLPADATWDDVRKAFRKITYENHADKTHDLPEKEQEIRTNKFIKAQQAMTLLKKEREAGRFGDIPSEIESVPYIPQQPDSSSPLAIGDGKNYF